MNLKHIHLAVTAFDDGSLFNYRDQLLAACREAPIVLNQDGLPIQQGIDADEMVPRAMLCQELRKLADGDMWDLESADHAKLVSIVRKRRWGAADDVVMAFLEAVTKGEDLPPIELRLPSENHHADTRTADLVDVAAG